jgi:hypothetical protein
MTETGPSLHATSAPGAQGFAHFTFQTGVPSGAWS